MPNIELIEKMLPVAPLKIAAMESCSELGQKVNDYIVSFRQNTINEVTESPIYVNYRSNNYLVDCACPRFGSGEAKGILKETIRGTDLFIMTDVCNYSLTYTVNGHLNHMSPDDHYQDLKRIISAATGKAHRINVIMPFLYESRQHKRSKRESLDCALALQELIARESDPTHSCVLTIGQFAGGTAANIIPETAVLQGTIRTNKPEARELLVRRMKEVAEKTAAVYNGTVDIEMISEVPPLICNPKLTDEVVGYMQELGIPGLTPYPGISASASEDFAVIAEKVPSTFMYLSAGYLDERGQYPAHHPKAQFNEDVCPIGAACLAHCASQWLKNNK